MLPERAHPLHAESDASLQSANGLQAVDSIMRRLASGERLERGGVMVQEHLSTGGKRIRARLALSATAALGATRDSALGWAAAVELLHNATLIHDDIQDGDRMRRGQPTTWVRHGSSQAINAGDLMLMLPFMAIGHGDLSAEVRWKLSERLATQATQIVRGQVEDLDMLSSESLSWASYLRVVENKTGGLFALPVEGAALIAGQSSEQAAAFANAFMPLGTLFQMQDDVLDLYGSKGRDLPGADLREGKVSALVVAHLNMHPKDRMWLLSLLRTDRDQTSQQDVDFAIRTFRSQGALQAVLHRIQDLADQVKNSAVLAKEPALHAVAKNITQLALQPIEHLWRQR